MTFEELVTWLREYDGYYHAIHCEDAYQRLSVLQMFQRRGFDDFTLDSFEILHGDIKEDDLLFIHPGFLKDRKSGRYINKITCYNSRLTHNTIRFVYFKDIAHLVYEDEEDDEILSLSDEDFCFAVLSLADQS